jgi:hypothetical protein
MHPTTAETLARAHVADLLLNGERAHVARLATGPRPRSPMLDTIARVAARLYGPLRRERSGAMVTEGIACGPD